MPEAHRNAAALKVSKFLATGAWCTVIEREAKFDTSYFVPKAKVCVDSRKKGCIGYQRSGCASLTVTDHSNRTQKLGRLLLRRTCTRRTELILPWKKVTDQSSRPRYSDETRATRNGMIDKGYIQTICGSLIWRELHNAQSGTCRLLFKVLSISKSQKHERGLLLHVHASLVHDLAVDKT